MSVIFDEEEIERLPQIDRSKHGVVTRLFFTLGVAKNPTQANIMMLVITVITLGLSIYILLHNTVPTPSAIEQTLIR